MKNRDWEKMGRKAQLHYLEKKLRLESLWLQAHAKYHRLRVRYLSWQVEKLRTLQTLGESYEFQRGENDE